MHGRHAPSEEADGVLPEGGVCTAWRPTTVVYKCATTKWPKDNALQRSESGDFVKG